MNTTVSTTWARGTTVMHFLIRCKDFPHMMLLTIFSSRRTIVVTVQGSRVSQSFTFQSEASQMMFICGQPYKSVR